MSVVVSVSAPTAGAFFLPLLRLRLELAFEGSGRLPVHPGPALRGLLGYGLRRLLCVTGARDCRGCALQPRCDYVAFFETPGDAPRRAAAPRPWALEPPARPPRRVARGDRLRFGLVLFGSGPGHLPQVAQAFDRMGPAGFGPDRVPFRLAGLWQETLAGGRDWQSLDRRALSSRALTAVEVPPLPQGELLLRLHTPLRLKRRGRLVGPAEFDARHLFFALHKRWESVLQAHGEAAVAECLPPLPAEPETALRRCDVAWEEWQRHSSRQRARLKLGGLVGELGLDPGPLASWWPLLWAGQWVGLGRQTGMGLGRYRLYASL